MNELELRDAIEKVVKAVKGKYSIWTIGITGDPFFKKIELGNPESWYYWKADTELVARKVEKYFLDKRMKGTIDNNKNLIYVYIF